MILFILCGVSNIGKKDIAALTLMKLNDNEESKGRFKRIPVHTTKSTGKRAMSQNSLIYTPEQTFHEMRQEKLIEYGTDGVVSYGIAKDDVEFAFKAGSHGLVVTSVEAARILKKEFPDMVYAVYCQTSEAQLPKNQTSAFGSVLTKIGNNQEVIINYLEELMLSRAEIERLPMTG